MMPILKTKTAKVTYPTGNKNFSVFQAYPAALDSTESDPFLMCDHFGPTESDDAVDDPDEFPVGWHPHRGMDICTYLIKGVGRHADSLGNRGTFLSPGIQWISVGSGIEHAEGGGTPKGEVTEGFQIWVNVPAAKKMDDPRYGINNAIPLIEHDGWRVRVVAGRIGDVSGPFTTVQSIQIVDLMVNSNSKSTLPIAADANNCIVYVYEGEGKVNGQNVAIRDVLLLDASNPNVRDINVEGGEKGISMMIFSGVKLNQPIAWRGPIVMSTFEEVRTAFGELQGGTFLKKRAAWDYRNWYDNPANQVVDNKDNKQ